MQTLEVVLAGLRGTLLAACSVSVSACTATSSKPAESDAEPPDKVFTEKEPEQENPPTNAPLCTNPTPVFDKAAQPTGYIRCADGAINRESVLGCAQPITAPACKGTEDDRSCDTAAQCTDRPAGFCQSGWGQVGTYCNCVYPCLSDADCAAGEACMCPGIDDTGPAVAECVPATCKTNSDCESGECGASIHHNGCGLEMALTCRGPGDACRSDQTCEHGGDCASVDRGDGSAGYKCQSQSCAIGRPLTLDDGVRVAGLDGLVPASDRARYWLGVAQMEHASVASFARFVGELLRFGAPPRLIADALAAAADEVRHAEQTFAIASAYAAAPLGPGGMQVDDLGPTDDPELFITRLIIEACVGETLGVAEALALLQGDLDPLLRPALEQIAADETRHAALAWRTLEWFAPRVNPAVIERAFEHAIRSAEQVDDEPTDPAHGLLGRDVKRRVRALAITSVIEPCRQSSNRRHSQITSAATAHSHA